MTHPHTSRTGPTDPFEALAGSIYDAVLAPARWRDLMEQVAAAIAADRWHLLGWNPQGDHFGLLPASQQDGSAVLTAYNERYGAIDPRRELSARAGPGVVVACHRHFAARFVSRSEFYQDFMLPLGLHYAMGGCLLRESGTEYQVGFQRQVGRASFEGPHEELLRRLMPHMARALQMTVQVQARQRSAQSISDALARLPLAVLAVDADARVLEANERARALLSTADPLGSSRGTLEARRWQQNEALRAAITRTARERTTGSVLLGEPGARYTATTLPPSEVTEDVWSTPPAALVLVAALDHPPTAAVERWIELFGLTLAEARVADALLAGQPLKACARQLGVSVNTAKTQLHSVFDKTGTSRQADLLHLLGRVPAVGTAQAEGIGTNG